MLEILWSHGECTVWEVIPHLSRPLAYTTVMTTLGALCRKGLAGRRKAKIGVRTVAYLYEARFSREEWIRQLLDNLIPAMGDLSEVQTSQAGAILVEILCGNNPRLLDRLLEEIEACRRKLGRRHHS